MGNVPAKPCCVPQTDNHPGLPDSEVMLKPGVGYDAIGATAGCRQSFDKQTLAGFLPRLSDSDFVCEIERMLAGIYGVSQNRLYTNDFYVKCFMVAKEFYNNA